MNKAWVYVVLTSSFELVWIYSFNVSTTWWQWTFTILFILLDLHFLTKACEGLPTGTVYAIFAAAGTIGTALLDIFVFHDSLTIAKIGFMLIILIGVIGLNVADKIPQNKHKRTTKHQEVI